MLKNLSMGFTFVLAFMTFGSDAPAQGTASGPITNHVIDPNTNEVWIGGPNDANNGPLPYPIDLDRDGDPWIKNLFSDSTPGTMFSGNTLLLHETIRNVGTEPWHDWHELLLGGAHGVVWGLVLDLRVNGSSITFDSNISGTMLTLDNFSQPVMPGNLFEIDKEIPVLTDNVSGPNVLIQRIAQYPTTNVPEPSTFLFVGISLLSVVGLTRRYRPRS